MYHYHRGLVSTKVGSLGYLSIYSNYTKTKHYITRSKKYFHLRTATSLYLCGQRDEAAADDYVMPNVMCSRSMSAFVPVAQRNAERERLPPPVAAPFSRSPHNRREGHSQNSSSGTQSEELNRQFNDGATVSLARVGAGPGSERSEHHECQHHTRWWGYRRRYRWWYRWWHINTHQYDY